MAKGKGKEIIVVSTSPGKRKKREVGSSSNCPKHKRHKCSPRKQEKQGRSFNTQSRPGIFVKMVGGLSDPQKMVIREMGLGAFLDTRIERLRKDLIKWMVDRIDNANRVLTLEDGRAIKLTVEDVSRLFGLPCSGEKLELVDNCGKGEIESWQGLKLKLKPSLGVEEEFKRIFLHFLFCTVLDPNTQPNGCRKLVKLIYENPVAFLSKWNLAEFVLERLMVGIKSWHEVGKNVHKSLCGCSFYLQIFYLMKFCVPGLSNFTSVGQITDDLVQQRLDKEISELKAFGRAKECPGLNFLPVVGNNINTKGVEEKNAQIRRLQEENIYNTGLMIPEHFDCEINSEENNKKIRGGDGSGDELGNQEAKVKIEGRRVAEDVSLVGITHFNSQGSNDLDLMNFPLQMGDVIIVDSDFADTSPETSVIKSTPIEVFDVDIGGKSVVGVSSTDKGSSSNFFRRTTKEPKPLQSQFVNNVMKNYISMMSVKEGVVRRKDTIWVTANYGLCKNKLVQSDVLVRFDGFELTRKQLRSLDEACWVNAPVVDMLMSYLNAEQVRKNLGKRYYFDSTFGHRLVTFKVPEKDLEHAILNAFEKDLKRVYSSHQSAILSGQLFIPHCIGDHWSFHVVNTKSRQVLRCDTCPIGRKRLTDDISLKIGRIMRHLVRSLFNKPEIDSYVVVEAKCIPQDNGYDCGVLMMKYIKEWVVDALPKLSMEETDIYRVELVDQLLTSRYNELHYDVAHAVLPSLL